MKKVNEQNKIKNAVFYVFCCLLLASCGNPISPEAVDLNKDLTLPVITIASPADNSSYSKVIEVSGTVSDSVSADDQESSGDISSLTYSVASAGIQSTEITERSGEAFSFSFSAASLSGTIVITITAEDLNGNTSSKNLTLIDAGNDIPSFSAVPGDGLVVLSWNEIPAADEYTVYYTTNGTSPSEYYYQGTIFPAVTETGYDGDDGVYTITLDSHGGSSLSNGSMHAFVLKASGEIGGEILDNYSEVVEAIPLADSDLCPQVEGSAGGINLWWNGIEGTDRYNVYRRENGNTESIRIAYNYSGTSFTDINADGDTVFFLFGITLHGRCRDQR